MNHTINDCLRITVYYFSRLEWNSSSACGRKSGLVGMWYLKIDDAPKRFLRLEILIEQ